LLDGWETRRGDDGEETRRGERDKGEETRTRSVASRWSRIQRKKSLGKPGPVNDHVPARVGEGLEAVVGHRLWVFRAGHARTATHRSLLLLLQK
jgi:hypothetical protein